MSEAGLSTPLHLAASLLALFASAGLAVIVLARPGTRTAARPPRQPGDVVLAAGALAYAVGHGLAGALVSPAAEVVPWLHAGGLALMAAGMARPRLRFFGGPAVIVPIAAAPAATLLSVVAGVVAAARAVAAGGWALALGGGLLAWGAAAPVRQRSVGAGAALVLLGSVLVGWWLWHASARALRAKIVTASVTLLLAVVVLIAGALSDLGSRDLVDDELDRLGRLAATIADDLEKQWPADAVDAATILGDQGASVLDSARSDRLEPVYKAFFRGQEQEFLIVLDDAGRVVGSFAPGQRLPKGFLLQIQGAAFVEQILGGQPRGGSLLPIGGEFVAAGGVPLRSSDATPEDPPLGAVVTGRRADAAWAAGVHGQLDIDVIVSAANRSTVASGDVATIANDVAQSIGNGADEAALTVGSRPIYAASAAIEDPMVGGTVGRAITVSEAGPLALIQQSQARRLFLLALFGALLSGAAAGYISGRLVAPIRRLTDAAAAVREGNLDVVADVESADEVGVLGRTFDEMTTSLASQSSQLRDAAAVQSRLRARLEALTSSMSDGLVAVNADGKVVTFNPAAQALVGRDITEVLGLPLDQVLVGHAPGDQTPTEALGMYDSEDRRAVQLLLERGDGRYIPTAVTAAPVHDTAGNQVLGRVFVLRDVTREVEVERMKSEFLSNVSHELRTPLTPIKGYAEVLARRELPPEAAQKFARQILDSTGRLERIVATIVDFAALDSGRMELRPEPVVLDDLVTAMLTEWRAEYPARDFRRRVERGLTPAYVDQSMLRRCLDELVSNAVKFSPDGGPITLLAASATYNGDGHAYVRLSVRDHGVGIEPEMAARIFSDFYQGDASETRHYGGLGLGLALVRRIVEGMHGHIELDTAPGAGATFHLLLPVD